MWALLGDIPFATVALSVYAACIVRTACVAHHVNKRRAEHHGGIYFMMKILAWPA